MIGIKYKKNRLYTKPDKLHADIPSYFFMFPARLLMVPTSRWFRHDFFDIESKAHFANIRKLLT